jgi:hypothetical protein
MLEKEREQPFSGQENSISTETSRKKSLKTVWICIPSTGGGNVARFRQVSRKLKHCFTQTAEVIDDKYSFIDELLFP